MKKARKGWLGLAFLLVAFSVISYYAFSPQPRFYPSYVSNSPSPTGVKGLYTYLSKEMNVNRWNHAPKFLPKASEKQLLVIVEPMNNPDSEEMKQYIDFIKVGNTVLLLQDNPKGMFDVQTVPAADEDNKGDQVFKVYDSSNQVYKAKIDSYVRLEANHDDDILFHDDLGTVALRQTLGKGQLIVAVTPEWMTNGNILTNDNLPLVISLLNTSGAKSILFDEYLHGDVTASSALSVYPQWFLLLLFQGIVLLILWLWHQGKRFGPVFTPREDSVRFSDEGLRAMAAWLIRGQRYHDSIVIQADYLKLLLQERWQIPYSREWQDLSSCLERKWHGIKPAEIRSFLQGLTAILEKGTLNKQEYLLWSGRLDQLRKEVEQG